MAQQLAITLDGFPSAVRPMQAVSADQPFRSEEYLFEVKWDGVRCLLFVRPDRRVSLHDRSLSDLTAQLPDLAGAGTQIAGPAVLDGELVATDRDGRPDHALLRRRLRAGPAAASEIPLVYLAFDALYLAGRSLLRQPVVKRRARLAKAVSAGPSVFVPEHVETEGVELFEACLQRGLEGIVAKHRDSTYVPGQRSPFWLKVKAVKSDDFVVIGHTPAQAGLPFGALLVAYYEDGQFVPCGSVSGGWDQEAEATLTRELSRLRVDESPLDPSLRVTAPVEWVRPELVVSLRYSEWTPDGTVRFPIFHAIRPEIHPSECVRQLPRVVLEGHAKPGSPAYDLTRFPF
jgi:DNA ligase D-like protein (predicted ligase)